MDQIRLIASDMDATLLDEHGRLPPEFEQTVRALAAQGIRFVAASGRPLDTLEVMFSSLREEMILVGDNGGAARWKGESLFVSEMPQEGWRALAAAAAQNNDIAMLCALDRVYVQKEYACYDPVFKVFYTRVEYVDDLAAVETIADKFTLYCPQENSQQVYDETYGPTFGDRFSVAVAGKNWVDITNIGVNKGATLEKLGIQLGIRHNEMMAFGDTYNDAEMLQTAKYGFLMENGSVPLRAKVPFLAPSNREHGVMKILERVLAQNGNVSPENFKQNF